MEVYPSHTKGQSGAPHRWDVFRVSVRGPGSFYLVTPSSSRALVSPFCWQRSIMGNVDGPGLDVHVSFLSHPIGQNSVMWLYLTARNSGKYSLATYQRGKGNAANEQLVSLCPRCLVHSTYFFNIHSLFQYLLIQYLLSTSHGPSIFASQFN